MNLDQIVSWNATRGYGHTKKGVFVHVTALCACLRPMRGQPVAIGTKVFITSEPSEKGEKASSAKCEKCSGPARWEPRVVDTATHPLTGEKADKVEYTHVGGEYSFDSPKADNSKYEAFRELARKWNETDLWPKDFGPAEFLSTIKDSQYCLVRQSGQERRVSLSSAAWTHPEWFKFERLFIKREVGQFRGCGYLHAVFSLPDGQEIQWQIASSGRRSKHGAFFWYKLDWYKMPKFANELPEIQKFAARVDRKMSAQEHAARLWRACPQETAEVLREYQTRTDHLEKNQIDYGSYWGSWTVSYPESDDGWRPAGSYNEQGTIYTAKISGFSEPKVESHGGDFVAGEAYRRLTSKTREILVDKIKELIGQYWEAVPSASQLLAELETLNRPELPELGLPGIETIEILTFTGWHGAKLFTAPRWNGSGWLWTYDQKKAHDELESWLYNGRANLIKERDYRSGLEKLKAEILSVGADKEWWAQECFGDSQSRIDLARIRERLNLFIPPRVFSAKEEKQADEKEDLAPASQPKNSKIPEKTAPATLADLKTKFGKKR